MALAPGTRIGAYQIQLPIGAGGMGEVYSATDSRLKRTVAVKILPADVSNDADYLARFEREAQVLAALNHPHIAAIYGFEESSGVRALVMELVEGQTLADRLRKGPMPVDETISLARQLIDALAAAHGKGIVHRDLKPANIKITPSGTLKVLDFGLAKSVDNPSAESDPNTSPTLTAMTQGPVIMGTAAYMSPEQARGKPVDLRTDMWSFGCVLFEMLARRRPFSGDTTTDILAGIIRSDVEWSSLPATTPPPLRRLLKNCLEKDPRNRLQNISDVRFYLDDATNGELLSAVARPSRYMQWILSLVAAGFVLLLLSFFFSASRMQEPPLRKMELVVNGFNPDFFRQPAISPDGKRIAYYAAGHLWIRELDQLTPHQIPDADTTRAFFWSDDGATLAYGTPKKLWKVPALGGSTAFICDVPDTGDVLSGAWSKNGTIALSVWRSPVYEVPAAGGVAKLLLPVGKNDVDFHTLSYLPDGKTLLFMVHSVGENPETIEALSGNSRKLILKGQQGSSVSDPVFSPTGHLLYTSGSDNDYSIWAAPFSTSSLSITGEPFVAAPGASLSTVANDGTLLYVPNRPKMRRLVWVNTTGNVETQIGTGQDQLGDPALSANARHAAVSTIENNVGEIWIYDLNDAATHHRLTFSEKGTAALFPVWSPAKEQIAFTSVRNINSTIRLINADGSGEKQIIAKGYGGSFSPDGKIFAYTSESQSGKDSLWYLELEGGKSPVSIITSDANDNDPQISPNGRFIAYVSDESGRPEVYVIPFPTGTGKWQASTNGGFEPRWSPGGDRLYFAYETQLMSVDVTYTPSFSLSTPRTLFSSDAIVMDAGFWPTQDGHRFLAVQDPDPKKSGGGGPMVLVQNWYSEFKKK